MPSSPPPIDRHGIIQRDSAAYAELHRRIGELYSQRGGSKAATKAWSDACDAFHSFESPMFELIAPDGLARLSAGDPDLVEWAIAYLEVDPFHFRSGYYKSWLMRRLKRLALMPWHQARLRVVALRALDDPQRAPSYYLRLAASLQSPDFLEHIRGRLKSDDARISQRAQGLLDYIDTFNRTHHT